MNLKKVKDSSLEGAAKLLGMLVPKEEEVITDSSETFQDKFRKAIKDIDVVEGAEFNISAEELGLEEFTDSIVEDLQSILLEQIRQDEDEDFEGNSAQGEVTLIDPNTIKVEAWFNV